MLKRTISILAATACMIALGTAQAAEKIVIGQPNWAYSKVITNVLKVIAEDNYGIEVQMVLGTHPVIFQAMDQGRGEVDIHPDVWLPAQMGLIEKYVEGAGTVALTDKKFDAMDAFCTTQAAKDKYGLASVYDLTKPEIVELTDRNGDGKGEMWMGAPGWNSTKIHQVRARDYGFADLYEFTVSEENLILAQIDSDVKAGRVIVWACYLPHHVFGMHDLVILEEPEHDPAKWNVSAIPDDPDWYDNSYAATAYPPITAHIAYSKRLESAAPNMVRLLNNIQFNTQLINDWSRAIAVDERDPEEYAREWVDQNQDLVKSWL
jgi:glycine betaine/proline transport system substrate-binding protein